MSLLVCIAQLLSVVLFTWDLFEVNLYLLYFILMAHVIFFTVGY